MKRWMIAATLFSTLPAFTKTVWIDVRTPEEFTQGHVQNATNLPITPTFATQAQSAGFSKNDTILLYCRSGHRADLAQAALQKAGYTKAQNLGGFADLMATQAVKANK